MFGGVGLYCESRFFALISRDVLYFKVDDSNRGHFEARGMRPFRHMSYYEVPVDVLEDPEECAVWARRSIALAGAKKRRTTTKVKR
jgi:DNA transformation protein